jgi:hypothetical protein
VFAVGGLEAFSPDYSAARKRFRQAASELGWNLEAHPIDAIGPNGEQLTVDVALTPDRNENRTLLLSSGVHGVEGFFGSAVQVGLLDQWANGTRPRPDVRCVFLHGLNPFGFAWLRRGDEQNIDPNRNFLLPGERYSGAPPGYASLDGLLNPKSPPTSWEPFWFKALWTLARHGMSALRQAIAAGQYDFPSGLFYGGAGPSSTNRIVSDNIDRWLQGSRAVVHLDFHTGLGRSAECKLLIDYPLTDHQRTQLTRSFGADAFEVCGVRGISYEVRGGLGRWCISRKLAEEYLFACAEFGTYGPIQMLAGIRAENQAHYWGLPNSSSTLRTKKRLQELFCPASIRWRSRALERSFELVTQAVQALNFAESQPAIS